ncbi:Tk-subtilisin [Halalkalicoccus paucihalophilus]|uniref:Tk-subtilisin n=1 Tax=Halalkalicoccus paucihalophilus TaxID=1008153 RepID=A0A151A8B4_9EURY|nr:S8 family serine peptidase [Halalkalicoccus paucihalophilus]KYH23800.1 Tk-subtilisin [Halalkalicoccus paucihalophilus]
MSQSNRHRTTTNRRRFLQLLGGAGAGSVLVGQDAAAINTLTDPIDDGLDTTTESLQETLIVFENNADIKVLDTFNLTDGYYGFDVLPIAFTRLTGPEITTVAELDPVIKIAPNRELEYFNDESRATSQVSEVQAGDGVDGYTGENVHSVVIDSGIDGAHPDLHENLISNWRWVGDPLSDDGESTLWIDAGEANTDDNGHGTHCSGTVCGDGAKSDGEFRGMAPDASLTVYAAGLGLFLLKVVAAYDHMIARKHEGKTTVQVVSNSYGASESADFDPDDPGNVATWYAYEAGILPVFSAGNDGPGLNTLNYFVRAPHVLGVAANHTDYSVGEFSSRGRSKSYDGATNYDRGEAFENLAAYYSGEDPEGPVGIYRNGIGAKGADVLSTLNPAHPLQATGDDTETFYGLLSGTSMSCPAIAGCAVLFINAFHETHGSDPAPIDVLNTLESEAELGLIDDVDTPEGAAVYSAENIGTGFINALEAVKRAEDSQIAQFDEVHVAESKGE